MDITRCAQSLYAVTGQLEPGGNASALRDARLELGKLIWALNGRGFPAATDPGEQARQSAAWADCATTAGLVSDRTGQPQPTAAKRVLLWRPDPADATRPAPADGPPRGLAWAFDNVPAKAYGPFSVTGNPDAQRSLFVYAAIDEARALARDGAVPEGFYPRPPVPTVALAPRTPFWLATACFVVGILLAVLTFFWLYVAADLAKAAIGAMETPEDRIAMANIRAADAELSAARRLATPSLAAADRPAAEAALRQSEQERAVLPVPACVAPVRIGDTVELPWNDACEARWQAAWNAAGVEGPGGSGTLAQIRHWFWRPTDLEGQLSLLLPLVLAAVAIALLFVATGLAGKGLASGAFIDERNRVSLSRLQQSVWSVILFGGVVVLGAFNVALLAGAVRRQEQAAAALDQAASTIGLFPSMDPALWAVLGITAVVSPYLSKRILTWKDPRPEFDQVEVTRPTAIVPETIEVRADPRQASWADMFMGEAEGDKGTLDISRLQHLIITGLLVGGYVMLLVEYTRNVSGRAIMLAWETGAPVFASMPPVDGTFLGLLALSHGAYLAFKAMPAGKGPGVT